jgi:hypothetical protein
MYCSDPFETEYVYGFDTKRVMDAGVDCITANILPTSVYHETHQFPDQFHKIHMALPLLRAQVKDHSVVTMLGVQDASEEFSVIDHLPVRLERDAYTMTAFCGRGEKSCESATEGFYICLGDGLTNVLYPTNAMLMITLGLTVISYPKWFKFTIKLQIVFAIFSCMVLLAAQYIGLGPF